MKRNQGFIKEERKMILEMINASWELADHLGKHPVRTGCSCIACVNKRKQLIDQSTGVWKFEL
jgi:hypothetical protein